MAAGFPCANCTHEDTHSELVGCLAQDCDCERYVRPDHAQPSVATQARARRTDPETSHAAAASLTVDGLRASQAAVLKFLQEGGPMTDAALVEDYPQHAEDMPRQSQSGLRSRRAELTAGGLVEDTGRRVRLESGRQAIVWQAKA